jgi:hypothetical protein
VRERFGRNGFVLRRHDVWIARHFRKIGCACQSSRQ